MTDVRRASVFRNGRNQAVRIPREFELPGREVTIRRDGERLVLEPVPVKRGLLEVLRSLQPSDEPFPDIDDPQPERFEL